MRQFKLSIFVFIVFLSGCSSYMRPVIALPEHESAGNNITILRNYNYVSGGMRFWPTVDGKEVSGLFSKTHISFELLPGKHSIGVRCGWSEDQLEVMIKEDELRYFKISPVYLFGCAAIEEIPKAEAIERLAKSTRIKTGYMSDCYRKSVLFEDKPDYTCATYILP